MGTVSEAGIQGGFTGNELGIEFGFHRDSGARHALAMFGRILVMRKLIGESAGEGSRRYPT